MTLLAGHVPRAYSAFERTPSVDSCCKTINVAPFDGGIKPFDGGIRPFDGGML